MVSLIGLGALVFAAIGVVVQLRDALNAVWEVGEFKERGAWHKVEPVNQAHALQQKPRRRVSSRNAP